MSPDDVIERTKIQFQRPCPPDAISVNQIDDLLGKKVIANIESGDYLRKEHIGWK
jgi:sialic acid synthase SpsE